MEKTRKERANSMNRSISTMRYLSLSARSAASALADPFNQPVFCLRESARSAGEQAVKTYKERARKQ